MGFKMGLVAVVPPSKGMEAAILENMFYHATLLEKTTDADLAYILPEEQAMVGETPECLLIVSRPMAYNVVSRPDFMPLPEDEAWLQSQSEGGTIVVAYMHSISEICGYVVFQGGGRVASHFHIDGYDTLDPDPPTEPAWLEKAPQTYTYHYAIEVIEAFLGKSLDDVSAQVGTWNLYAVD